MEKTWWLERDGNTEGPYDESEVTEFIQKGRLTEQTSVWKDGMDAWAPAGELFEFASTSTEQIESQPAATPPPIAKANDAVAVPETEIRSEAHQAAIWLRRHGVRLAFGLVFFAYFLPFATVSCAGMDMVTVNGYEAAFGFEIEVPGFGMGAEDVPGAGSAIVPLIAAGAGLANLSPHYNLGCAIVGAGSLLYAASSSVPEEVRGTPIRLNARVGYYLSFIFLFAGGSLRLLSGRATGRNSTFSLSQFLKKIESASASPEMARFCNECGNGLATTAKFCDGCGAATSSS